jgi:exonuclease SbcD
LVFVAGDLFDTAAPVPESEKIVYSALMQLAGVAEHVVVIGGNHDNQRRLEAIKPFADATNLHIVPSIARPEAGGVLKLTTQSGEPARVALLPFVSQRGIVRADDLMADDADDHSVAYRDRLSRLIEALCRNCAKDAVNLLMAHAMVDGGKMGGGERDAHTIFDYSIPTTAFPAHLHYVALGHLHRAQSLPGRVPIEYCGSPLHLDFGEEMDEKSVAVIDANPGKPATTERIPLSKGRRLRTIRGTLKELQERASEFGDDYLRVEVTGRASPGLADQIRGLLPSAVEVRVAQSDVTRNQALVERMEAMRGSPVDLFQMYLKDRDSEDNAVCDLFKELLDECDAPEAS